MSVTLVEPEIAAAWTPATAAHSTTAAIVATRATTFMRTQAQWLHRGLQHADCNVALGIVLAAHDRAHERWVAQIHAVEQTLGEDAAHQVATVYAYVGRIAGSLEAGTMQLLTEDLATHARQLLAERLTEITEHAVEAVWSAAASV